MGNVVVDSWSDKIVMSNPGSMLVSVNEFYEGQHSVCRNPLLQKMFVFIGVGEKAGSGADVIVKGWEEQKWTKPVIEEHFEPDRVEIVMRMVEEKGVESMPTGKEPARGLIGEGLSWDQVGTKSGLSRDQVESLLKMMIKPVSASELRTQMNIVNASKFKKKYLDPLIEMGLVEMTRPEVPNSRLQQYVLTEQGKLMVSG